MKTRKDKIEALQKIQSGASIELLFKGIEMPLFINEYQKRYFYFGKEYTQEQAKIMISKFQLYEFNCNSLTDAQLL